jgi:hypothetical protein
MMFALITTNNHMTAFFNRISTTGLFLKPEGSELGF